MQTVTNPHRECLPKLIIAVAGGALTAAFLFWHSGAQAAPKPAAAASQPSPAEPSVETSDSPAPATNAAPRFPVPEMGAQLEAERAIKQTFKDDFSKASQAAGKLALAAKLIAMAEAPGENPATLYVALREASNLSATAGDAELALRAIDELGSRYEVDAAALKVDAFNTLTRSARDPNSAQNVARAALDLIPRLIGSDDFEAAARVASIARTLSQKSRDQHLMTVANYYEKQRTKPLAAEFRRVRKFFDILKQDPADPTANLEVGKFYCFSKESWSQGCALLRAGSDPALKKLAEQELQPPVDSDGQLALGNDWWEFAEKQAPADKRGPQLRAKHWLIKAAPQLQGLVKAEALKKMARVAGTPLVLRITIAELHGEIEIRLAPQEIEFKTISWATPELVTINGLVWNPKQVPALKNEGWTRLLPDDLNYASAKVAKVKGRGEVSIKADYDRVVLKVDDVPETFDAYEVTITFAK
jgi:hypothetical protein